jgi:drug/metabolite transporter (DMT)-like permease
MLASTYPFFVFFLIGSAFVVNKMILGYMGANCFVVLRMGISGVLMLMLFCRSISIWKHARKKWFVLSVISCFTTLLPSTLRAYALCFLSSSRAAFWGVFEPFIAATYMYFLFKEKITKLQVFGCIIGIIGAMFFIFTNSKSEFFSNEQFFSLADLAQIMSIVFSRFGWIVAQRLLRKDSKVQPQQMNAFTFTITALISLIIGMTFYNPPIYKFDLSYKLVALGAYTVIVGNMIAYTLYAGLLKTVSVTYISLAGLSIPIFVHLIAPIFCNEQISFTFFVSMAFIFVATFIFNMGRKKTGRNTHKTSQNIG